MGMAETVSLGGTDYEVVTVTDGEIGPGIRHTRYRLPEYPLNINVLRVDLTNPYNTVETTVANESAKGTETLVHAAERQSAPGHRALAGANANFWVVASQPEQNTYTGTTRGASVRNGVIVTESNQHRDQWDGGTMRTGVVSMSSDKTIYADYCTSYIRATSEKFGQLEVHQVNKGIHPDELAMYNSFYGDDREFMPIYIDERGQYQHDNGGDATEVLLDLDEGQQWGANSTLTLTVAEVRTDAGKGRKGTHSIALVGRGDNRAQLAKLVPGDKVTISYGWVYNPGTEQEVSPVVTQAVGPNALVMRNGELTANNENEAYNSMVYSRTGYGCSQDGKTLYIIVIDKSTDPVHGTSAGCNTATMCEFVRTLGCYNMANFDAGGSAQMFVKDRVENRTTEGTPRAVANGWMIYSIAPEDAADYNTVTRLEFDAVTLQAPVYASFSPKVIAYNRYGAVIDEDFKDYTLSCEPATGSCTGNTFYASGSPAEGTLTASYNGVSTSKAITVLDAQMALRVKQLLIDGTREYPVEVVSNIGSTEYGYDPATLDWTVDDTSVATIDANGILHGVAEGTTGYSCRIGDFSDRASVTVEIASAPTLGQDNWSGWTTKKATGMTNVSLTDEGLLSYTYNTPRDPWVSVTKDVQFYSLPDHVFIEFSSDLPVKSLTVDFRSALHSKLNNVTLKPAEGEESFAAGTRHTLEIPISELGDTEDLALYPISLKSIRFSLNLDPAQKGDHSIDLGKLYATYGNSAAVEMVEAAGESAMAISPNPVAAGSSFTVNASGMTSLSIFSPAGILMNTVAVDGDSATVTAPATPGAYIVQTTGTKGNTSKIIIVK